VSPLALTERPIYTRRGVDRRTRRLRRTWRPTRARRYSSITASFLRRTTEFLTARYACFTIILLVSSSIVLHRVLACPLAWHFCSIYINIHLPAAWYDTYVRRLPDRANIFLEWCRVRSVRNQQVALIYLFWFTNHGRHMKIRVICPSNCPILDIGAARSDAMVTPLLFCVHRLVHNTTCMTGWKGTRM
jgi:hypothetical protein